MRTTCIRHPENEPLIKIHKWQLEFCEGDRIAAALLSFFEYWHNIKLDMTAKNREANDIAEMHGDARNQDESLWQFHTEDDLERGVLIFKRRAINDSLQILVAKGVIQVGRNPNERYKFDRTRFFLFDPDVINDYLEVYRSRKSADTSSKNAGRSSKSGARSGTNAGRSSKSVPAITEITSKITSEIPDSDAKASAHADAAPAPADASMVFRKFHDELKAAKNKAPVLRQAYVHCYGEEGAPDHGRLGAFARNVGGWGMALDLLWSCLSRPPNGNVLDYLEATHKARKTERNKPYSNGTKGKALPRPNYNEGIEDIMANGPVATQMRQEQDAANA